MDILYYHHPPFTDFYDLGKLFLLFVFGQDFLNESATLQFSKTMLRASVIVLNNM